jgi:hypothetical protein
MLLPKMGMDINQIIELWRGLSPHLARPAPGKQLSKDEQTDEKKSDEDTEGKIVEPIESHYEEEGVEKEGFKCLLIPAIPLGY